MLADEHIYDIILKYISTSQDLIVDKWYIDTDKIFDKLKNNYPNIICVQLCVSAKVATKRYNERLINNLKPILAENLKDCDNVEINFGGMKNALQYKYPGRDGLIMKKEMHKLYKSEQFKNALEKVYKMNYRDVVGSWDQIKSVFDRKPKTGNKLSEV